ncbi:unnamed protein product, partial [marine sediment metagenome]
AAVKQTGDYERCCEYWFNNQLIGITDKIKKGG